MGLTMRSNYWVALVCGCSFRESRPDGWPAPVDGELRSCGTPEHYTGTNVYAATYTPLPDWCASWEECDE